MRHRERRQMPATSSAHAKALIRNQAISLIIHGQIITTTAKAKAARPEIERLITRSVRLSTIATEDERVSQLRILNSRLRSSEALDVLVNVVARIFEERPGGYTRVLKCGFRKGDNAPLSLIQLVTESSPFEDYFPDGLVRGVGTPKERYAFLKDYCLANRRPGHTVLDRWMSYPFPRIEMQMTSVGSNTIRTTVSLPQGNLWKLDAWPRVRGVRVPLELRLRLYADAHLLETVTTRIVREGKSPGLRLLPPSSDGLVMPFVFDPEAHKGETKVIMEHQFAAGHPLRMNVVLANPYRALASARWQDLSLLRQEERSPSKLLGSYDPPENKGRESTEGSKR